MHIERTAERLLPNTLAGNKVGIILGAYGVEVERILPENPFAADILEAR